MRDTIHNYMHYVWSMHCDWAWLSLVGVGTPWALREGDVGVGGRRGMQHWATGLGLEARRAEEGRAKPTTLLAPT